MDWLVKLLGGSIGSIFSDITGLIDDMHTSDEEKMKIKNALTKMKIDAVAQSEKNALSYEDQISKRWVADSKGSWLSKSVRPLVLLILLCAIIVLSITDGNIEFEGYEFVIGAEWVELYKNSFMVAITAYFGGRSYEKVNKANDDIKKEKMDDITFKN